MEKRSRSSPSEKGDRNSSLTDEPATKKPKIDFATKQGLRYSEPSGDEQSASTQKTSVDMTEEDTFKEEERQKWERYRKREGDREPEPLLQKELPSVLEQAQGKIQVLDIACGFGIDALYMAQSSNNIEVTAFDRNGYAIEYLKEAGKMYSNLKLKQSSFEDFPFENNKYHLINARYCLPFEHPDKFNNLFYNTIASLKEGGIFVGQLFGDKCSGASDPNMTFHTKEEVEKLFLDIEQLGIKMEYTCDPIEYNEPGRSGIKHWHVFNITGKRQVERGLS